MCRVDTLPHLASCDIATEIVNAEQVMPSQCVITAFYSVSYSAASLQSSDASIIIAIATINDDLRLLLPQLLPII